MLTRFLNFLHRPASCLPTVARSIIIFHHDIQMSRFTSLKVAEIKPLLTAIGAKTSGTKAQLITQLERELRTPKFAIPHNDRPTRILSVDMGIKNLAFCVCDVRKGTADKGVHLEVRQWRRIGVLDVQGKEVPKANDENRDDPFGPASLSSAALRLVRDVFWPFKADTVLIERQRFRSGGGSAVLEWTLRVNMLESMIWAIARTLNGNKSQDKPELFPVNPKQVANFWIGGDVPEGGRTTTSKSKIEKKQKIDLVHKWISGDGGDGGGDSLTLDFVEGAVETKRAFLAAAEGKRVSAIAGKRARGAGSTEGPVVRISKLDDLADCLLQAAAWCKWEGNRSALAAASTPNAEALISDGSEIKDGKARKQGSGRRRKSVARQQP